MNQSHHEKDSTLLSQSQPHYCFIASIDLTMPPLAELGFTCSLRETLTLSRCKLDEWVEHEKAKADAQAESYRQAQSEQQQRVDRAVTHLLALQLEGGLTVNEDERKTEKNGILKQTEAAREEIAELQQELQERTARVKGELSVIFYDFIVPYNVLLVLLVAASHTSRLVATFS